MENPTITQGDILIQVGALTMERNAWKAKAEELARQLIEFQKENNPLRMDNGVKTPDPTAEPPKVGSKG